MPVNRFFATISEDLLAELTAAAYLVVLRHGGVRAPFIDVQLDPWRELRQVLRPDPLPDALQLAAEPA